MGPSDRDAGDRRWGNDGAARRYPAAFQPVPSHAARAPKKLPSLNRRNEHAAQIRLGLPEPPTPGGDFVSPIGACPSTGSPQPIPGRFQRPPAKLGGWRPMAVVFPCSSISPSSAMARTTGGHTMAAETRSAVGQVSVGSGASRSENIMSDQGTLGAQSAEMRTARYRETRRQ